MNKKRIVLVDDDVTAMQLLKLGLESTGRYEVRGATSGPRGLLIARQFKPDIMVLDVMMPEGDGQELAAELMADPNLAEIPIIFMTSLVSAEDADRPGIRVGYRYIAKPAPLEKVIGRIEEELTRSVRSSP